LVLDLLAAPVKGYRDDVGNGRWRTLAALAEPRRRSVFEFVTGQPEPVTRDDVAASLGIARALAAHHLDRLVESGLLTVRSARRTGGGVGRPAKHYSPAQPETVVSVPPRSYDVAARIFARALASDGDPREAVLAVAAEEGRAIGARHIRPSRQGVAATLAAAAAVLEGLGYEPTVGRDCVRLRNCPFHGVAEVARELTCTTNHTFVAGVLEGLGGSSRVEAVLEPPEGRSCCVELRRGQSSQVTGSSWTP
jgi:predicted ArsR family transcriptional regulator